VDGRVGFQLGDDHSLRFITSCGICRKEEEQRVDSPPPGGFPTDEVVNLTGSNPASTVSPLCFKAHTLIDCRLSPLRDRLLLDGSHRYQGSVLVGASA